MPEIEYIEIDHKKDKKLSGTPIVLSPETHRITYGTITALRNGLTGTWFIYRSNVLLYTSYKKPTKSEIKNIKQ